MLSCLIASAPDTKSSNWGPMLVRLTQCVGGRPSAWQMAWHPLSTPTPNIRGTNSTSLSFYSQSRTPVLEEKQKRKKGSKKGPRTKQMVTAENASPLWIQPLVKCSSDAPEVGRYEILQRLVTESPVHKDSEIETAIELFIGPNDVPLWKRVVVRSGPICPQPIIHASFPLPGLDGDADHEHEHENEHSSSPPSGNVICWTAFAEQPNHPLLCVLANPTLLCIWDVYPDEKHACSVGEGHSVPLPFEASSIHPLTGSQPGLLIQRIETADDHLDAQSKIWTAPITTAGFDNDDDDNDHFVLQAPPKPVRTSMDPLTVSSASFSAIPSLFSLLHPLDDVLPISNMTNCSPGTSIQPGMIDDVFEKVLFVGTLTGVDPKDDYLDRKEFRYPICVTYHTVKKRHAIWEIQNAPAPPPPAPLWQVSRHWRSENGWNSHIGVLEQDLEDMALLGETPKNGGADMSHYDAATRNDALADALGIRKTPRKAVDDAAARGRTAGVRSASRGRTSRPTKPNPNTNSNGSSNNMSLISPVTRHANATHDSVHTPRMDLDASVDSTGRTPLLTMGPFASLYPKVAMTCLYEDSKITLQASRVFLASNLEGSGRLTVCILFPEQQVSANPNSLRLFSMEDRRNSNEMTDVTTNTDSLAVKYIIAPAVSISCVSAVPLESSPVVPSFHPHPKHRTDTWKESAVDILVLRQDHVGQNLTLFRGRLPIIDCSIQQVDGLYHPDNDAGRVYGLENSIGDCLDFVLKATNVSPKLIFRAKVSLRMSSSATSEKILGALESAVFSMAALSGPEKAELSVKIRSDCRRLEQALASTMMEDVGKDAIGAVVTALFQLDLLDRDVNNEDMGGGFYEESSEDQGSAWEQLLRTQYHKSYELQSPDFLFSRPLVLAKKSTPAKSPGLSQLSRVFSTAVDVLKNSELPISETIFLALHQLYEEFKLNDAGRDDGLFALGTLLARLCGMGANGTSVFLQHYKRDLGDTWYQSLDHDFNTGFSSTGHAFDIAKPFCIFSWVDGMISGRIEQVEADLDISSINPACERLRSLVRVYKALYAGTMSSSDKGIPDDGIARDFAVVRILIEEGFKDKAALHVNLTPGLVLPLLEVLHRCRACHQQQGLKEEDPMVWSLIGRDDLRNNAELEDASSAKSNKFSWTEKSLNRGEDKFANLEDKDLDGLYPLEHTSSMLYPDDNRMREVGRLLRSSRAVCLNVPRAIEVSDHDYERLKQEKLLLLSRRVLALPLGRGMVTIGNLQPVPAEPLPLPELCLVGRVTPTNAMLALDTADCPVDMKVWPDFNNGVAAGLRLPLEADAGELLSKITRTWIVYNRPGNQPQQSQSPPGSNLNSQPNLGHAHGGLLMALGLRGHLTTLEMTDIFDYLTQGSVTTTVGVLLGMAANMRGTCDISVSKMLCLHIPSLIPQHFSAIDVASAVQAAAVSGAGLLYQGSSHRMMTEFLLNEIGKRPSNDINVLDREAYTLSCGIALGMVNLCQGEAEGRSNGNSGLADLRIEERLYRYIVGGLDDAEMRRKRDEGDRISLPTTSASNGSEKCSCVYEGDSINTDVTAPGSTLALGLIYMKSGNKTIASAISIPDTHFLLEYVRPDFLMLRVIARSLILWYDVQPTSAWIESQLPSAVKDAYTQMQEHAENLAKQKKGSAARVYGDYDRQAVRLIYTHIIAGACFSIGLRFAGTGNHEAASAIFERVMEFRDLRDGVDPVSCALRPPSPVLEMCIGCAALSLAMVRAGTGDLETLRLLKVLRWRCDEDINYGSHMAFGSAIGLLFLGGGTSTIGREPEDIAALLLAFYPRFPSTTSDNQYHLQALRNLYALAIKRRDIKAIDVDTFESVFVPIQVHYDDDTLPLLNLTAPCLLSNSNAKAREIRVLSERYYPVVLRLQDQSGGQMFFVKRRTAHLSYQQDPESKRSLVVQTGGLHGGSQMDLLASFTDDKRILSFAKHFCGIGEARSAISDPFTVEGFCRQVVFESLMVDTQEALPLYLVLRNAIDCIGSGSRLGVFVAWDFRLIRTYYTFRQLGAGGDGSIGILNRELVVYLNEMLEKSFPEVHDLDGPMSIFYDHPPVIEARTSLQSGGCNPMDLG